MKCPNCPFDDRTWQHRAICEVKVDGTPRVTEKPPSVTEKAARAKRLGRPASGNALTPAEKQRAYRERKRQ